MEYLCNMFLLNGISNYLKTYSFFLSLNNKDVGESCKAFEVLNYFL